MRDTAFDDKDVRGWIADAEVIARTLENATTRIIIHRVPR
jgi:hypothetical protein